MAFARDPLANPETLIPRVYAYAAYRLGDGPDAEDVTSDAFERALRYRRSYDRSKGQPVAWLIGIARRCVDEALAARGLVAAQEAPDLAATTDMAAEAIERLSVRDAIAVLEERDRELIALRYGADLTARQIAGLLVMRTNAVEVALGRARARLAAHLARGTAGVDDPRSVAHAARSAGHWSPNV